MSYKIPATSRASKIEYAIRDVVVPAAKLEEQGIIGPSDGTSRPREVFIDPI